MSAKYDALLSKLRESDESLYDKGRFANYAAIIAAYPTGEAGWYVLNYDTDTFWVWDADTSAWINTYRCGEVFQSDFTSANSTGFVWVDNVLTVTHNLNKTNPFISLKDNATPGELINTYFTESTDANNIAIYFPVEAVPITGTWNIRIF